MGKKRNVKAPKTDEKMKVDDDAVVASVDEEEQVMDEGTSEQEEDSNEDEEDDEEDDLMTDNVTNMGTESFDFEAFPLNDTDIPGLVNLLTQMFLRSDVNVDDLAKNLVEMSPVGSVFRPAEEALDDDDDSVTYGVMGVAELVGPRRYQKDISNLILSRAKRFASKDVLQAIENIFNSSKDIKKNYLLINERMLHFPQAIAAPGFGALKSDLEEAKLTNRIDNVVIVSKVRVADSAIAPEAEDAPTNPGQKKKKMGKAEKKRQKAAAVESAEVQFENQEEELLFNNGNLINPVFFQYSVEGDVEKESKFHTTYIDGVPHRPYRRVSILTRDEFFKFVDLVVNL